MQTIYVSAPRLLLKDGSPEGVMPPESPSMRLSPKMLRTRPSSLMRHVGTRWLWQRQSKISRRWMEAVGHVSRATAGSRRLCAES
jgi:hypothetical protein